MRVSIYKTIGLVAVSMLIASPVLAEFDGPAKVMSYKLTPGEKVEFIDRTHIYTMTADTESGGLCREGYFEDLATALSADTNDQAQVRFETCSEKTKTFAYVCFDIDETGEYEQGYCGAFSFEKKKRIKK
jgi:hypothetical protein